MLRELAFALLALTLAASAQTAGQLTPTVVTKADTQQTYALYLPSHFDTTRRWPVLYILDPGARGAEAAEHFRAAAEQLGYIVAASNVSHNGPAEASMSALQAMSIDVESRFPTDPKRRYVAGLSGGARAAFIAGMVCSKCFAGVLGFGAGLPVGLKFTNAPDFAYLAGVGEDDFNYAEVTELAPLLDKLKADYRILTYKGPHDWPNPAAALEALSWMDFSSVKHNPLTLIPPYPAPLLNLRMQAAKGLESSDPPQAAREYESIIRDFEVIDDTKEAVAALTRLRSSSDYKKAVKDERAISDGTTRESISFDIAVQSMLASSGESQLSHRDFAHQIVNEMHTDERSKDRVKSTIARRVLSSSFVTLLQTREQLKPAQAESAIDLADLATVIYPDRWDTWYWLAIAQLNAGHRRPAIAALRKAVNLGASKTKISDDKHLAPLAGDAEVKALIAQ